MIIAAERSVGGWVTVAAVAVLIAIYLRNRYRESRAEAWRAYEERLAYVHQQNIEHARRRAEADFEARVDAVFYDQDSEAQ